MIWASYKEKYGSLAMQHRMELIAAYQMSLQHHCAGGEEKPLSHFMVVTPKIEEELSLEEAMQAWD